jgi:hypothetical protein
MINSTLNSSTRSGMSKLVWRRGCVPLLVLLLGILCAGAHRFVSAYDEQMDSGLAQLNTDVTAFANKMINSAGQTAGAQASSHFYTTENAKVETSIVRADTQRVQQLPLDRRNCGGRQSSPSSADGFTKFAGSQRFVVSVWQRPY